MRGPRLLDVAAGGCPRCGRRTLFAGRIRLADRCGECGLDIARLDIGDGPAAFLILIVGGALTVAAVVVDLTLSPPWWLHLLWIPVGLGLTLGGARLAKAVLVAQIHRHRAGEGRIAR